MSLTIRQATPADTTLWLDLVTATLGSDFPDKQVFNPAWIGGQFDPGSGSVTWVAEVNGLLHASLTCLAPGPGNLNPVTHLGRQLIRPEGHTDGSAELLLQQVNDRASSQDRMLVAQVLASDQAQQALFEKVGFVCAGFQPCQHQLRVRESVLFYVRTGPGELAPRLALCETLPQIRELAAAVLEHLRLPSALAVFDGVAGHPLPADLSLHDATFDDFGLWRLQTQATNPPTEIPTGFNRGCGLMRIEAETPLRAVLAQREARIVAGLAYQVDESDRCLRLLDAFSADDLSLGALMQRAVKIAQEQRNCVCVEVDVLATAPRLLKCAEQLGFVPTAYLPGFFNRDGQRIDVVRLVKLNTVYSLENTNLTPHARGIVEVVNRNFEDQKLGLATVNLLRSQSLFGGLGDGDLCKIARLCVQRLYRPGERVFNKGDAGNEAYVVMRGQVDLYLDELAKPVGSVTGGQIFGEFAFLEDSPRTAVAFAGQASILLIIHRAAFNELIQREPHVGVVILRNIAQDLSAKLRRANATVAALRK
jgi:CRP/FNR family cyclic AMP-dependent transcriptional regulator